MIKVHPVNRRDNAFGYSYYELFLGIIYFFWKEP